MEWCQICGYERSAAAHQPPLGEPPEGDPWGHDYWIGEMTRTERDEIRDRYHQDH